MSKNGIDRRDFNAGAMAVGAACLLPGQKIEEVTSSVWVCLLQHLGGDAYLAEICGSGTTVVMSPAGSALGSCTPSPAAPGCFTKSPQPDFKISGFKGIYRHPDLDDERWEAAKRWYAKAATSSQFKIYFQE